MYRLTWLVVMTLMVGCAPSLNRAPANAPTSSPQATQPAVPATRILAPTMTVAARTPTATPMPAQACHEAHRQQQVSYLNGPTLGRRVAYSLYLPPCYDVDKSRVYPAVYLSTRQTGNKRVCVTAQPPLRGFQGSILRTCSQLSQG
jgi:hypothetical protein